MKFKKNLFLLLIVIATISACLNIEAHRWGFGAGFGYGLVGGTIMSNSYWRYPQYSSRLPFYYGYYPAYYGGFYPYYSYY